MASELPSTGDLLKIQQLARSILDITGSYSGIDQTQPLQPDSSLPDLDLSFPDDIFAPLHKIKLRNGIQKAIMHQASRLLTQLGRQCSSAYKRAYFTSLHLGFRQDLNGLQRIFEDLFRKKSLPIAENFMEFVFDELTRTQPAVHAANRKRPFNHKFVPFLELYLHFNAFPSNLHKSILAQKSGMNPHQIDTWFQNRRRRSKEKGQVPTRMKGALPLKRTLDALDVHNSSQFLAKGQIKINEEFYNPIPSTVQPARDSCTTTSSPSPRTPFSCLAVNDPQNDPFRPAHAFPVIFDRNSPRYFSNGGIPQKFPPPLWPRKPSSDRQTFTAASADIAELVAIFQRKMTFREGRRKTTPLASTNCEEPWFSCNLITPPRGCHPAYVPAPVSSSGTLSFNLAQQVLTKDPGDSVRVEVGDPFASFIRDKPLSFNHLAAPASEPPAWAQPSRVPSFGSDISSSSLSQSPSSSNSSPGPSTPPQLPEQDMELQPTEFGLDEFAPDKYDFSIFDFGLINHPDIEIGDYNTLSPVVRQMTLPDLHTPFTTVDPSQLTLRNIPHIYSNYLAISS